MHFFFKKVDVIMEKRKCAFGRFILTDEVEDIPMQDVRECDADMRLFEGMLQV